MRLLTIILFLTVSYCYAQVEQTHRYELQKKNDDDYFTVLPVGEDGILIFRDTDKYKKGNILNVVSLDTALNENWNKELSIDVKYEFKAYDIKNSKMYLLFRDGNLAKDDYHLMSISFADGNITRYDIKNELTIELSHMAVLEEGLVLAGYVNYSPTLVLYKFGDEKFEVVPGFFKDRSTVVDLRDNGNSTFNVITIEKGYNGSFLRFRTYSYDGEMLFERELMQDSRFKIISAKSSGFIDGNVIVSGTYGNANSYYAVGIYVTVVKPDGQDNIVNYHEFYSLEHYFDYMKPKRAERIKNRMKRRLDKGKDVHYTARLLLHEIQRTNNGYLIAAEIYDPEYTTTARTGYDYGFTDPEELERRGRAAQTYAKQPSRVQNVDDASEFEYIESVVFETNKKGEIIWDNSMKINDVEIPTLEQVVQIAQSDGMLKMLYLSEELIYYKAIQGTETVEEGNQPLKLHNDGDEIVHTYSGVGKSEYWYDNNFIVWGFHKVDSGVSSMPKRNVLYVNKITFK